MRQRSWLVFALAGGVMAALLGVAWLGQRPNAAARLARHLPESVAAVLHVDVAALSRMDVLPKLDGEEDEYRRFIASTGFVYQRDLESVVAGFDGPHAYLLAQGRFDWSRLQAFAKAQGGSCQASQCRMPASTPGKWVAWFPLRDNVMALASSPDPAVVNHLAQEKAWATDAPDPTGPVWLSLFGAAFAEAGSLPSVVRPFAAVFGGAERVVLSFDAQGPRLKLTARCARPADATALANNLLTAAIQLGDLDRRQRAGGLNAMLANGSFAAHGRGVTGSWPIPASLLKAD